MNLFSFSFFVSHQYFITIIDMMQMGKELLIQPLNDMVQNSWCNFEFLKRTIFIGRNNIWHPTNACPVSKHWKCLFWTNLFWIINVLWISWNEIWLWTILKYFLFNLLIDFEMEHGDDKKQCERRLIIYFVLKGYF